jgi:hypothetical protein
MCGGGKRQEGEKISIEHFLLAAGKRIGLCIFAIQFQNLDLFFKSFE